MKPLVYHQTNSSNPPTKSNSELFNTEKIYSGTSLETYIGWGGKDGLLRLLRTSETVPTTLNHRKEFLASTLYQ